MKLFDRNINQNQIKVKAFGILQLSIAVMAISLLATGILLNSSSTVAKDKTTTTVTRINAIYNAIGAYLLANKKLPCPASLKTIKSNDPVNYGLSVGTDGNCAATGVYKNNSGANPNLIYGMVPVKTLGLSDEMAEDGFDSKIVYIVDQQFTQTDVSSNGFGLTTISNNLIIKRDTGGSLITDTSDAIFTIISYGADKNGAFNANSNVQNSIPTDSDERNNLNDNANNFDTAVNFDNIIIASSSASNATFDDIVLYKSRNQIVTDFKAMNLIPCPAVSNYITVNGTGMSWAQSSYNQIAISTTACPACWTGGVLYPTLQCQDFGTWASSVTDACVQIHGGPCP